MEGEKIIGTKSSAMPFQEDNLDTDQSAPTKKALFVLTWDELKDVFCYKLRFNDDGSSKGHILDAPQHADARVLLAGDNFGCGSSREHATQATKARFDAVIAPSFAPIFEGNAAAIGLIVVRAEKKDIDAMAVIATATPDAEFAVDLQEMKVTVGETSFVITMESSARDRFLAGTWDERVVLAKGLAEKISEVEDLPSLSGF
jgi:3-isopropylmalate/(R)-2-methylmalate dehydratase small subunit